MQPMIPVAFQGTNGAYSEKAVKDYASLHELPLQPLKQETFIDLFDIITGKIGLGMVPIENARAGAVVECYDLLLTKDVEVIGEYLLEINHCLLALPGTKLSDLTTVYSHPQALAQCSLYLQQHGLIAIAATDTASAAQALAANPQPGQAVIASEAAATEYGLDILAKNIQNGNGKIINQTRFLFVKKKDAHYDFEKTLGEADKTSILFETADVPAALHKALGCFATNDVNLLKIESRPSQQKNFDYIFYVDLQGAITDAPILCALEELAHFSKMIKVLGSYKRADA